MNNKRAAELISDNLKAVYGYAFGKLFDKDDVDDLVSDIVVNALKNADRIKDEQAFWGYFWRVAETTFLRFIKNKNKHADIPLDEIPDGFLFTRSVEDDYVMNEEQNELIYALRRELSLLSKTHRDVTVAYYIQGKSCSQIASEQNLSVEMVKYHLFEKYAFAGCKGLSRQNAAPDRSRHGRKACKRPDGTKRESQIGK